MSPFAMNDAIASARLALACLDLTELGDACHAADIDALCARAQGDTGGDRRLPPVAAVCVWPRWASYARQQLPKAIAVAAVVNFPSGNEPLSDVLEQVAVVRAAGAQEVDCVLPWQALLAGDEAHCRQLLQAVRAASQGLVLKLILETGALPDAASIHRACHLGLEAGVDFLKTSTGKTPQGASLVAARCMLQAMAAHPQRERLGFKPSGGLRTVADVQPYMDLVRATLGETALVPARFRIGASSLWTDIARVWGGAVHPATTTVPGGSEATY